MKYSNRPQPMDFGRQAEDAHNDPGGPDSESVGFRPLDAPG